MKALTATCRNFSRIEKIENMQKVARYFSATLAQLTATPREEKLSCSKLQTVKVAKLQHPFRGALQHNCNSATKNAMSVIGFGIGNNSDV